MCAKEGDIIPIHLLLYLIGARYIFGNKNFGNATHMLSNVAGSIVSNPYKIESTLNVVRMLAPLTSAKTVSKINVFLPIIEKFSSILGMYSFLNKAQNYAPIQSLSDKPPLEKISALISNGNIPIGKVLAQPLIAKNMDKIVGQVVQGLVANSLKDGNMEQMISSLMSEMSSNSNSKNMSTQETAAANKDNSENGNSQLDIGKLIEMFGPLLNNSSNQKTNSF
ncbi:hypothetical protein JYG23_06360 [Sedimentibacter sp. zth1]|uniref:hypothetical protein n=1 Tax=Sedimentibacter sp. zth1 TaxID=2816908 RepID=UPI001A92D598|nr:hypothetical protein [Sedimentibacter sp. zth1]QSX07008.1 hypothetical protein JYG23_06360 [Sedimentibacter sp. zth1]